MAYPTHGDEFHERQSWKIPCRAATTTDITIASDLNAGDTLDGVLLAAGDRVLVKDQASAQQNGIYIAGPAPARAIDYASSAEIVGSAIVVIEGTANAGTAWLCTTPATITVGTTGLAYTQLGTGGPGGGTPTLGAVLGAGNDTAPVYDIIQDDPTYSAPTDLFLGGSVSLKSASVIASSGYDIDLQAGAGYDSGGASAGGADVTIEGGGHHGGGSGGTIYLEGGSAKVGSNADGGDVWLIGGTGDGSGRAGLVMLDIGSLPTSDPGVSGAIWNDSGTLKVSP